MTTCSLPFAVAPPEPPKEVQELHPRLAGVEPPHQLAALEVVGRQQAPDPAPAVVRRPVALGLLAPTRQAGARPWQQVQRPELVHADAPALPGTPAIQPL